MKKSKARIDQTTIVIDRKELEMLVRGALMKTEALRGQCVDRVALNFDFLNEHGASSGPISGLEVSWSTRQVAEHPHEIA